MKLIPTLCIAGMVALLMGTTDAAPVRKAPCAAHKAKVNTPWENRADTNDNGRVSPGEAKGFRQTVQEKRVVDTRIEGRIDRNDDGVIGRYEANRAWHHRHKAQANR